MMNLMINNSQNVISSNCINKIIEHNICIIAWNAGRRLFSFDFNII